MSEEKKDEVKKNVEKVEKKDDVKKTENKEQFKKVEGANKSASKEKKQKNVKTGEKKKNVRVTGIIIAVVIIAIVAVIAVVGLSQNNPTNALNEILTALKTGDYSKIENYNELLSGSGLFDEEDSNTEAQKLLFEKLEWNIKEEKVEGDTATINLDITNKDFKQIIDNYTQRIIKAAFGEEELSDEQIEKYLIEELGNEEVQNTTVSQTITMNKVDGKWTIADVENTVYVLLPGLSEAMEALK